MDFDWNVFWTAFTTSLISSGICGAIVLALLNRRFDREREQFRRHTEEGLHRLQDQLIRGQYAHTLQCQREFEGYQRIWDALVHARDSAIELRPGSDLNDPIRPKNLSKPERLSAAAKSLDQLRVISTTCRPFMPASLWKEIQSLLVCLSHVSMHYQFSDLGDDEYWDHIEDVFPKINKHVDALCDAIRERIGEVALWDNAGTDRHLPQPSSATTGTGKDES